MPILRRPEKISTVTLPSRTAVVAAETQVLIVGGGPAGLGAAFGAARAGADVILAERYGFLGGNATAALVIPISSYYTHQNEHQTRGSTSLFPTDHGDGNPTIAGALGDLVSRLVLGGGALPPSDRTGYTVPFDPEIFKAAAFGMLDSAGANYLLHCFASSAFIEDAVSGAVFETKSGPVVIRAQVVVDCTGDGDMAASAGATFEVGREDGGVQPMTLLFRMGEFEKAAFDAYVKEHPDQWYGIHGLWDLIRKAEEAGELDLPREDILFFGSPHEKEVDVNSSRIINVLGTDVWDLTYAEWEGRRQVSMISA
ncbi:MAG TPA: FAD-dependent oxidoreductase, partial [Deltaproteobacteria bacterium]|nr:FAD-dependent oxidoreductase [Deltaproteobacteria bacterium]